MMQKNLSPLNISGGSVVIISSEGKHRGLLYAGIWLLAVGFVLMFKKIFSGSEPGY